MYVTRGRIHACIHIHTYVYTDVCVHVICTHAYTCVYERYMCTLMYTRYIYTLYARVPLVTHVYTHSPGPHMYVHMYTCACVYERVRAICVCVCKQTHTREVRACKLPFTDMPTPVCASVCVSAGLVNNGDGTPPTWRLQGPCSSSAASFPRSTRLALFRGLSVPPRVPTPACVTLPYRLGVGRPVCCSRWWHRPPGEAGAARAGGRRRGPRATLPAACSFHTFFILR